MIIVEKQAKGNNRHAARYVQVLADYMRTAKRNPLGEEYGLTLAAYMKGDGLTHETDATGSGERVLAVGGRLRAKSVMWDEAMAEMHRRLAKRSGRLKKPARHLVASYRAGEEPSEADCDAVAQDLAEELDCEAGAVLWALHGDTDNRHLHILVLTLDDDGAATPFGRQGKSHEAMQRAIARLEHAQGLASEAGARYEVVDGEVRRRAQTASRPKSCAPIRTEVLQWEEQTGLESFTRYAQEQLAPLLERSASWTEAQGAIAPLGAMIMKAGSGGEIQTGDGSHRVKLSNVNRQISWSRLVGRWGEWTAPVGAVAPYRPRILDGERAAQWAEHDIWAEAAHGRVQGRIDRLRAERTRTIQLIRDECSARLADLASLQAEPGDAIRLREGIRAIYQGRAVSVDTEYKSRIAALCDLRQDAAEAPDLAGLDLGDFAVPDCSLEISWAQRPTEPEDVPGFRPTRVGEAIQYWSKNDRSRQPAFVERGNRVWINDRSDAALRAALIVAKLRYGDVAAFGDAAFIARAKRLGRELGIEVQDGVMATPKARRPRSARVAVRREAIRLWREEARQGPQHTEGGDRDERRRAAGGKSPHAPRVQEVRAPDQTFTRGWTGVTPTSGQRRRFLAAAHALIEQQDWDAADYGVVPTRLAAGHPPRGVETPSSFPKTTLAGAAANDRSAALSPARGHTGRPLDEGLSR